MWWKKRKAPSLVQENVYSYSLRAWRWMQKRFVASMQKLESHLTNRQKKIYLIVFCCISAAGWCWLIYTSVK